MGTKTATAGATPALRWTLVLSFALLAFFASYRFAIARSSVPATGTASSATAPAGASGGGCCGGGGTGAAVTKKAAVKSGVQAITVDTSQGSYNPNTIKLKAGIPAEITFTQSSGCLGQVQSQDLDFFEDLTAGPKTIKLGSLKAGTYTFTCGMQMVSGTIVVE